MRTHKRQGLFFNVLFKKKLSEQPIPIWNISGYLGIWWGYTWAMPGKCRETQPAIVSWLLIKWLQLKMQNSFPPQNLNISTQPQNSSPSNTKSPSPGSGSRVSKLSCSRCPPCQQHDYWGKTAPWRLMPTKISLKDWLIPQNAFKEKKMYYDAANDDKMLCWLMRLPPFWLQNCCYWGPGWGGEDPLWMQNVTGVGVAGPQIYFEIMMIVFNEYFLK